MQPSHAVALMLGRCGYEVTRCGSISELEERGLTNIEYDLVLCDVMLDSCSHSTVSTLSYTVLTAANARSWIQACPAP